MLANLNCGITNMPNSGIFYCSLFKLTIKKKYISASQSVIQAANKLPNCFLFVFCSKYIAKRVITAYVKAVNLIYCTVGSMVKVTLF